MEQPVTVAIIEDHPVVAEGVASWMRSDPGQRVRLVQRARDLTGLRAVPRAALRALCEAHRIPTSPRSAGLRTEPPHTKRD